jgi:hypothetical protein
MQHLRFWRLWIWRWLSSWVVAPCSRVRRWTMMMEAARTSETQVKFYRLRGPVTQKTAIFIFTAVTAWNRCYFYLYWAVVAPCYMSSLAADECLKQQAVNSTEHLITRREAGYGFWSCRTCFGARSPYCCTTGTGHDRRTDGQTVGEIHQRRGLTLSVCRSPLFLTHSLMPRWIVLSTGAVYTWNGK